MQMEFDITNLELANLKRKLDTLDPVTQAGKVVEYLDGNYTQKQLGEKLGKTRDWIAKRVQLSRYKSHKEKIRVPAGCEKDDGKADIFSLEHQRLLLGVE